MGLFWNLRRSRRTNEFSRSHSVQKGRDRRACGLLFFMLGSRGRRRAEHGREFLDTNGSRDRGRLLGAPTGSSTNSETDDNSCSTLKSGMRRSTGICATPCSGTTPSRPLLSWKRFLGVFGSRACIDPQASSIGFLVVADRFAYRRESSTTGARRLAM